MNQAVGSWTSKAVGRTGDHQVLARSKLTESYSKLYPVVVMNREANVAEGPAGLLPLHAERPPLRVDEGRIRVGKSRISLDLVIEQYDNGMRPEDMVSPTTPWDWPTSTPSSPSTSGTATKCAPT